MAGNGIKQPQQQIQYGVQYIAEDDTIMLSVNGVSFLRIPFKIYKDFHYKMSEARKAAQSQLLVPDKRIVMPGKQ